MMSSNDRSEKAPSIREMLTRARKLYHMIHQSELWLEEPSACVNVKDLHEVFQRGQKLNELAMDLGRELVGAPDFEMSAEQRDSLCHRVGHTLIEDFHSK